MAKEVLEIPYDHLASVVIIVELGISEVRLSRYTHSPILVPDNVLKSLERWCKETTEYLEEEDE